MVKLKIADVYALAGLTVAAGLIAYGCHLAWHPLGYIIGGILLAAITVVFALEVGG